MCPLTARGKFNGQELTDLPVHVEWALRGLSGGGWTPHPLLHVDPGGEGALGEGVRPPVQDVIEDL